MGWYTDADKLFKSIYGVKYYLCKKVRVNKEALGHSDNRITEGNKETTQAML